MYLTLEVSKFKFFEDLTCMGCGNVTRITLSLSFNG
jgi:hypothetical protein